jgi:hypothetical protein
MISISPAITNIIFLDRVKYFLLVSIGNNKHFTSNPFDITMSNGITYLSDGGLAAIDPPTFSSSVDRSTYGVTFADVTSELKSFFETGATGASLSVRLGFYNTLDDAIEGVEVGEIFNNINDTILIYKGVVDGQSYMIDPNNSEIYAKIEGSSPMADLDLVRPFYTNKDSMQQKNPNDNSFDKVFEGSGSIKLKWGRV